MKLRGRRPTIKESGPANASQRMITLRLPIPVYNQVVIEATKVGKSLNQFLLDLVSKHEEDTQQQQPEC